MRKDVLYESVKRFVKTRKEDLNAGRERDPGPEVGQMTGSH